MRLEYFQLVDRIVTLSVADRRITAESAVPESNTIFEGHFPGHPLMPGVLLVEAMAQTSGWLLLAASAFERMPLLAQIKEAKLRTFVTPGTVLTVTASIVHEGSGFSVTRASITAGGKTVCDADLTLRMMPFPTADLRSQMQETAKRIGLPVGSPVDA
jgi:3-hydroxyacyl-[acyl-carrier-protein] dehydratase